MLRPTEILCPEQKAVLRKNIRPSLLAYAKASEYLVGYFIRYSFSVEGIKKSKCIVDANSYGVYGKAREQKTFGLLYGGGRFSYQIKLPLV